MHVSVGKESEEMWISGKKWEALEKRVTDLEGQIQGQPRVTIDVKAIRQNLQKLEANRDSDVKDGLS